MKLRGVSVSRKEVGSEKTWYEEPDCIMPLVNLYSEATAMNLTRTDRFSAQLPHSDSDQKVFVLIKWFVISRTLDEGCQVSESITI